MGTLFQQEAEHYGVFCRDAIGAGQGCARLQDPQLGKSVTGLEE